MDALSTERIVEAMRGLDYARAVSFTKGNYFLSKEIDFLVPYIDIHFPDDSRVVLVPALEIRQAVPSRFSVCTSLVIYNIIQHVATLTDYVYSLEDGEITTINIPFNEDLSLQRNIPNKVANTMPKYVEKQRELQLIRILEKCR